NNTPDECEPDCNTNGVADDCDISAGTSQDCNTNAVPDECELDGDGDGVIDDCDGCPDDPYKTNPGLCGCGVLDVIPDGDLDTDCDVDLDDYVVFQACFGGPYSDVLPTCSSADFDADNDVDLADFALLMWYFDR
ncbi:MAG: hypothetical protein KAV82_11390, partial [Phycisphaerae bacterium]|nr:hypothetical protein [Phycisphaerae bacterium]